MRVDAGGGLVVVGTHVVGTHATTAGTTAARAGTTAARAGIATHRPHQPRQLRRQVLAHDLALDLRRLRMHLRLVAGPTPVLLRQLRQPCPATAVHQQVVDEPQRVIAGGAVDGHRRLQHLGRSRSVAGGQDLLQQEPAVTDELARVVWSPRISQPVG